MAFWNAIILSFLHIKSSYMRGERRSACYSELTEIKMGSSSKIDDDSEVNLNV